KLEAKLDMTHVPFRGTGPAMQAVIAGHIQMAFSPPTPLISHFAAGTLRPIAATSPKRAEALRDVPTVAELGFPGFEAMTWHSLVAPAGTPKAVIAKLHEAALHALRDPEVRRQFTDMGIEVSGTSPEELRAYIKSEIPKWAKIVRESGAKAPD
ncbi:MAG: tripartite tricarboxylate transporter substrate binding protein, partial [Variibacter sp.]|nr:tripartite tricarboxylate transporter substrate binding protein [Variibacter sp.]